MKKLRFVFKNGKNTVYDEHVDYEYEDGVITFSHDKAKYLLREDPFGFTRDYDGGRFFMYCENDEVKSHYVLLETNTTVDIDVVDFDYKIEDKRYTIKYSLSSDEEDKTIILTLD